MNGPGAVAGSSSSGVVPVLCGPTAAGKSAAAMALAGRLPIEIVSMDSAQVYRGLDIGTAKPTAAERAEVPHHLIDIVEPDDPYSAARFARDGRAAIEAIRARGRVPLVVGGTLLYLRALADGLSALPAADARWRAALEAEARVRGWPALHARLAEVDPVAAARLSPNDGQRIQRALEVHASTGRPLSEWIARRQPARSAEASAAAREDRFAVVSLEPPDRAALHARIAARFDAMLAAGLVEEVRALRARGGLHAALPAIKSVGYRQVWAYLDGHGDRTALRERGIAATRQLAKRQLTWLRSMPERTVIDCLAPDAADRAADAVEAALRSAATLHP